MKKITVFGLLSCAALMVMGHYFIYQGGLKSFFIEMILLGIAVFISLKHHGGSDVQKKTAFIRDDVGLTGFQLRFLCLSDNKKRKALIEGRIFAAEPAEGFSCLTAFMFQRNDVEISASQDISISGRSQMVSFTIEDEKKVQSLYRAAQAGEGRYLMHFRYPAKGGGYRTKICEFTADSALQDPRSATVQIQSKVDNEPGYEKIIPLSCISWILASGR